VTTITQAIETYLLDCQTRSLRLESLRTYRRHLTAFRTYAEQEAGITQIDQVSTHTLRLYVVYQQGRGLQPSSILGAGRSLRAWFNFLIAEGLIGTNPMQRVRLPKRRQPDPDAFTAGEVQQLIKATQTRRDRAIVLCLLDTGCRVGEFTAWRRSDIDPAGRVTLRAETTKTHASRIVFLGKRSRTALTRYLDEIRPRDRVWVGERSPHTPLTVDGMKRAIQRIGAQAGVKPAGPHRYRRTFATVALARGMNIYDLAAIMGHKRIDQLRQYLRQDAGTLAAAHARYSPVDHLLK
jgi:integrase/recombinase XerD